MESKKDGTVPIITLSYIRNQNKINMKKQITLTESELTRVIKGVINEQNAPHEIVESYERALVPGQRVRDQEILYALMQVYDNSMVAGKIDRDNYNDAAHHFTQQHPGLPILPYETLEILTK